MLRSTYVRPLPLLFATRFPAVVTNGKLHHLTAAATVQQCCPVLAAAAKAVNGAASAAAQTMEAATSPPGKKTKSIATSINGTPLKKATSRKPATAITPTPEVLQKAQRVAEQLNQLYPSPAIPLNHSSTFQLLVAVILSAQTTDKKVNEVTPHLFKLAPDAAAMAAMDVADIQAIIQPIGLAPTKARNLSHMSKVRPPPFTAPALLWSVCSDWDNLIAPGPAQV
eukprot:GHRQ01003791.1.p1 GENE.GHRQ01003791.1~~GHRQ01003791.1.p1  ORF type:complete len:225 (+),score=47.53 GHRQ01003791.1:393-1067(+)